MNAIYGFLSLGYEGVLVSVEIDMSNSIPGLEIVGLAANEVKEARERVRIAIRTAGFVWPSKRIFINLSPADIKKRGAGFDLPIAIAILSASGQIDFGDKDIMAIGELQFNARVRPVANALSASCCTLEHKIGYIISSEMNAKEVFAVKNIKCCVIEELSDLRDKLTFSSKHDYLSIRPDIYHAEDTHSEDETMSKLNLSDLSYCDELKRVIQIAAAGRHNLHLSGPPGSGKTAAAIRIISLLPRLTYDESIEISKIYASSEIFQYQEVHDRKTKTVGELMKERPIRMPHHTATAEAMIGSAARMVPGEISLAHTGVLILDEAPEFKMQVLQSLREPMDNHIVHISRSGAKWECPSDFQLVLTSNLCPCGNLGKAEHLGLWCMCSEREIFRYWKRIGGAIWDRIDIKYKTKASNKIILEPIEKRIEKEKKMQENAQLAINVQRERARSSGISWNSRYGIREVETYFLLSRQAHNQIVSALRLKGMSERGRLILARLSRTIADLDASELVNTCHVEEALAINSALMPMEQNIECASL